MLEPYRRSDAVMTLRRNTLVVLGLAVYAVVMAVGLGRSNNMAMGIAVTHLSVLVAFVLSGRLARRAGSANIRNVLLAAMLTTVAAAFARYFIDFSVYRGVADSALYSSEGHRLSEMIRAGDLTPDVGGSLVGTRFVSLAMGYLYALTGPSPIIAFVAFSWVSFFGLYLFYLAFRVAYPYGRHRTFALLLFFLPSLTVWTRGVGKDALMAFSLGLTVYGFARVTHGTANGILLTSAGLACAAMVRPHVALLVALSLLVGVLARRRGGTAHQTRRRPVLNLALGAALLMVATVSLAQLEKVFGPQSLSPASADEVFSRTEVNTAYGGSEFESARPTSITGVPFAVVTVLFRPFLTEARNVLTLVSAIEGAFLFIVVAKNGRRIVKLLRGTGRTALAASSVCFWVMFAVSFASLANFGLLVRQRTQLLPFVLLVVVAAMGSKQPDERRRPQGAGRATVPVAAVCS